MQNLSLSVTLLSSAALRNAPVPSQAITAPMPEELPTTLFCAKCHGAAICSSQLKSMTPRL